MRRNPDAPPLLKFFADAMFRYHSGEVRYVKLLDGGMVDNYGLAGFTIARLASEHALRAAGAGRGREIAAAVVSGRRRRARAGG